MAEFRKWTVSHEAGEHKTVVSPPGFDAAMAREIQQNGDGGSGGRAVATKLPLGKRQELLFTQATAPFKQVAMLCFMMWMSGTALHLFSIMTTLNGLYQPLSSILKSGQVFPSDPEGELNTSAPRALYCLVHGAGLAFALYKINSMGLLPTHLSDWTSSMRPPTALEHALPSLL